MSASLLLLITLPPAGEGEPAFLGWEANAKGKLGPRKVLCPFSTGHNPNLETNIDRMPLSSSLITMNLSVVTNRFVTTPAPLGTSTRVGGLGSLPRPHQEGDRVC